MIFRELPAGRELFELPSLSSRKGAARLAFAARAVGEEKARAAALVAGPYLLEDELCQRLRLDGLELPPDGELRALSPNRWEWSELTAYSAPTALPLLPEGAEICGLILTDRQEALLRRLAPFVSGPQLALRLAEHLFYEESLKLVVSYTAPRFKPT